LWENPKVDACIVKEKKKRLGKSFSESGLFGFDVTTKTLVGKFSLKPKKKCTTSVISPPFNEPRIVTGSEEKWG